MAAALSHKRSAVMLLIAVNMAIRARKENATGRVTGKMQFLSYRLDPLMACMMKWH